MANEIDLSKLKKVINEILDMMIERSHSGMMTVSSDMNFYWNVLGDDLFDLSENPAELGVGSIGDDVELLSSGAEEGGTPIVYCLIHAAPLLRYLAELHSKSNEPYGY